MALSPRAAALLARFPGPVQLRPSSLKWIGVLAICLVFVGLGVWMIRSSATDPRASASVGWMSVAFFGLGIPVALAQFLPGASGLTLDAEGFESRQLFRRHRHHWSEVGGFAPWESGRARLVVFEAGSVAPGRLAEVNRHLTGRNAALSDTYGLGADDLAALLEAWRQRALSA